MLSIEALAGRPAAGAWITGAGGAAAEPAAATVFSRSGARVVRSVSDIPGWSATWQPRHGPAVALAVQRDGLVQAVDVPAGLGVITWSYTPPLFPAGLALSLAATAALLALLAFPALLARPSSGLLAPALSRRGLPGLPGRWPGPGAHEPATPTAALSASRAADWRAASARSNGPAQASPTWWRRFVACRHSEAALARMKSRYSGRGRRR